MSLLRTAKEVTRDLIAKVGLNRAHVRIRKFRGQNVEHLLGASLSERFTAVYKNRVWLNGRSVGALSGWGSELENTRSVRAHLAELLNFLDTRWLLDIGCGDFTWMKDVPFPFRYCGIDLVQEIIQKNNALWGSEQRSFHVMDATRGPLPQADTILCREVLFHLSFADIRRLVQNVQSSGGAYLVATNDNDLRYNADIISGDFRLLNLRKSPFFFPRAAASIPDDGVLPHRTLSAWKLAGLPKYE
jgi:hypothetical protein